ncbi:MAG: FeoB-associated Cys-rich membrane protein [Clostridiales bacterium]|nr:FeoB-associated Cys-rich membrane protein [Clostridiales bacterium]
MLAWISENIATIIICVALVAIVVGIIFSMIRNKKKGKSSCGCGCSNCALNGTCHPKK